MARTTRLALTAALAALLVAGCDSGSSSSSGSAGIPPGDDGGGEVVVPTTVPVTVAPSLGLINLGTVRALKLDGSVIASGFTDHTGTLTLQLPEDVSLPFILEVRGNAAATYYDEALDELVSLTDSDVLRTLVGELPDSPVAITALTEMAATYLEQQHGNLGSVTPEQIAAAHDFIREQLAPELADLLQAPTLVGSGTDAALLGTGLADLYALKLAALARVAQANAPAEAAPALAIIRELADDLADGVLDGKRGELALLLNSYDLDTLAAQLLAQAQSYSTNPELDALIASLPDYVSALIAALGGGGGGDEGGGDTGPGDLLASWAGNYSGTWSQSITTSGNGILASTLVDVFGAGMNIALNFVGNTCVIDIDDNSISLGAQTFNFNPALAVAATGGNRTFTVPVALNLTLLGITVGSNSTFTLNTGGTTPGSATLTASASTSSILGSASASYTGTCAIN